MARIRELASILARVDDERLVEDFLVSILTPREVAEVARRWELVKLLDGGMSQRAVSRRLGMSLCKITRGSRELQKRNSAFRRVIRTYVTP
jgi:TrpR family transcriptional regulator, trp operon repressor